MLYDSIVMKVLYINHNAITSKRYILLMSCNFAYWQLLCNSMDITTNILELPHHWFCSWGNYY